MRSFEMAWFRNLQVKLKLFVGFCLIIAFTIAISLVSFLHVSSANSTIADLEEMIEVKYSKLVRVNAAIVASDAIDFAVQGNMSSYTPQILTDIQNASKELVAAATALDGTDQDIKNIQQAAKIYTTCANGEFSQALQKNDEATAVRLYNTILAPNFDVITRTVTALTKIQMQEANTAVESVSESGDAAIILIGIIAIISVILGILVAQVFEKNITSSLNLAVKASEEIADGNLTHSIHLDDKDEFGQLVRGIEKMRLNLIELVQTIKSSSHDIHDNVEEINNISDEINESAQQIQSRALTVAAASDEMVSTTADIAKNCEVAAETAYKSNKTTNEGVSVVEDTIQGIQEQVVKSQEDVKLVQNLVDQAQKIGTIVNTISDIANQTNLLALNAAIEAARAGEAGKGFAVVADEVRALASRTSISTQEITKMVGEIQTDANSANDSMNISMENMSTLSTKAENVHNLLQDIIEGVSGVTAQITQIATAAEQQTTATTEISTNMKDITDAVQGFGGEVAHSHEEVSNAMERLAFLVEAVNKIKIKD